jgi:hypothetical protein
MSLFDSVKRNFVRISKKRAATHVQQKMIVRVVSRTVADLQVYSHHHYMSPYLLSRYVSCFLLQSVISMFPRGLDPLVGVFTGFLAYYLHETHPRTALHPEEKLSELLRWKYNKYQQKRRDVAV